MLLGKSETSTGEFDPSSRSALQETANVLAGAYSGALGSVIGGIVMISVPLFGMEPPDDVLARDRASAVTLSQALCIETAINIGSGQVPCGAHIVLLPLGGAMDAIVSALQPSR